jgi:hypothetical protein
MKIMDVAEIAKTALLVGSTFPAYKALIEQVIDAFDGDPDKQADLKQAYEQAVGAAEAAHLDAQSI